MLKPSILKSFLWSDQIVAALGGGLQLELLEAVSFAEALSFGIESKAEKALEDCLARLVGKLISNPRTASLAIEATIGMVKLVLRVLEDAPF